jgi:hypothetical protein
MHRRLTVLFSIGVIGLLLGPAGRAEVIESTPAGFTTKTTAEISAGSGTVYRALTGQVGAWWDPQHTWSGNPRNMTIDPRADGCFCEKLTSGGTVQHMTVTLADPGKTLRLRGALGPLHEQAVIGTMTWTLTDAGSRTRVEMTYVVGGYMRGGLDSVVRVVDQVLTTQVGRLKRFVEFGLPS